ncbi:hypothetical protein PRIPAC_77820 [Pristionchus pacificus]|uniref:Tetraspannin n=1 Tax=Pristionchus pacificus TaxID=54126 RepID=A0A2A6BVV3_PRIPA|nr:hypothetical protein PRIPAC_77820 [Pristionchus pacificus]|eukprot:PDM69998.1 Tetraspannin [Pristionchus pacificus]
MPLPRFHAACKVTALGLNAFFLVCSGCLIAFTVLAASSPPPGDISPRPVAELPLYTITLVVLGVFACALFLLSLIGIASLLSNNSFFLSLNILCQLGLIAAQFVVLMFTLSIRAKIHSSLIETWDDKDTKCVFKTYPTEEMMTGCSPLARFRYSEKLWYFWLAFNFLLQARNVALLICSTIVCERLSYQELRKDYENRVKEPEDEDED